MDVIEFLIYKNVYISVIPCNEVLPDFPNNKINIQHTKFDMSSMFTDLVHVLVTWKLRADTPLRNDIDLVLVSWSILLSVLECIKLTDLRSTLISFICAGESIVCTYIYIYI